MQTASKQNRLTKPIAETHTSVSVSCYYPGFEHIFIMDCQEGFKYGLFCCPLRPKLKFMIFCLFFFTLVIGVITALLVNFKLGCCYLGLLLLVNFILICFNEHTKDGSENQDKNIKICVILSISLFVLHIVLFVCQFYFAYRGKLQNVL